MNPPPTTTASPSSGVPFVASTQLCYDLVLAQDATAGTSVLKPATPRVARHLPGQPLVKLDADVITPYLGRELLTPRLNHMAPYLWLVATPRSSHITALHAQRVRGRTIVVTEDPELHLVWMDGRVFVKPLPPFLLSHAFWACFLSSSSAPSKDHEQKARIEELAKAAIGFVRTYYYLIKHESDFQLAKEAGLFPAKTRWPAFAHFIRQFGDGSDDAQVSARYHYGELRLTRLNRWAPLLLGQWQFHKPAWQYSEYFARLYGPLLFIFATVSVILSAMQVGAQVRPSWDSFFSVAAWFAVATLLVVAAVLVWLILLLIVMAGRETLFAVRSQYRRSRKKRRSADLPAEAQSTAATNDSKA